MFGLFFTPTREDDDNDNLEEEAVEKPADSVGADPGEAGCNQADDAEEVFTFVPVVSSRNNLFGRRSTVVINDGAYFGNAALLVKNTLL